MPHHALKLAPQDCGDCPIRHRAVVARIKNGRVPCGVGRHRTRNTDGAGEHSRGRDGGVLQERTARNGNDIGFHIMEALFLLIFNRLNLPLGTHLESGAVDYR